MSGRNGRPRSRDVSRVRSYYPMFADLAGRRCVVIGGGAIAEHKVAALLRCGARVSVVSPTLSRRLAREARRGRVGWRRGQFRPTDLAGTWLACAATADQTVNARVFRAATTRRIFCNVVDEPAVCSFITPAIARRGQLCIAVSTGGASPALAKQIRRSCAEQFGPEYARLLRLLRTLRGPAKDRLATYDDRRRYFEVLVRGRVAALVRVGRAVAARREALRLLERHAAKDGPSVQKAG